MAKNYIVLSQHRAGGAQGIQGVPGNGFITATFTGEVTALDSKPRWSPKEAVTIQSVRLLIDTAPAGNVVIDVLKNGVSVFGVGAKPTILAGANSSVLAANVAVLATDYLQLSVINGGGSDLTVFIDYV